MCEYLPAFSSPSKFTLVVQDASSKMIAWWNVGADGVGSLLFEHHRSRGHILFPISFFFLMFSDIFAAILHQHSASAR